MADSKAPEKVDMEFWYDFASPYAYMASMRIDALAGKAGVSVRWRPFIIGPLFRDFGHEFSPVFDNKVKWAYLQMDVPRQAAHYGVALTLERGDAPVPSILGARVALLLAREANEGSGLCPEFSKRLFVTSFAEDKNIMKPEVVAAVLADMGEDPEAVIARALTPENKQALKDTVDDARKAGLFGIPSFTLPGTKGKEGEMFWGNDRLEQAIAAAAAAAGAAAKGA